MDTKLEITWGTTKTFELRVTDQDGDPVILAGKALTLIAKRKYSDLDVNAVFTLANGDGITPGASNDAEVKIASNRTTSLSRTATTSLRYQLFMTEDTDRFPLQEGVIVVKPSVAE